MNLRFLWLFCFCGVMIFPILTHAAGTVKISEIAWMGTVNSANDEWIEFKNETSLPISFEGWTLRAEDGQPSIALAGVLVGNGYFLLERTDDNTIPGVVADQVYAGALSNSGEVLVLRDASGVEQDRVSAQGGWIAGDNTSKTTMQWVNGVWTSGTASPKSPNIAPSKKDLPVTTVASSEPSTQKEKTSAPRVLSESSHAAVAQAPAAPSNNPTGTASNNFENTSPASQPAQTANTFTSPLVVNILWLLGSIAGGMVVGGGVRFFMRRRTG